MNVLRNSECHAILTPELIGWRHGRSLRWLAFRRHNRIHLSQHIHNRLIKRSAMMLAKGFGVV